MDSSMSHRHDAETQGKHQSCESPEPCEFFRPRRRYSKEFRIIRPSATGTWTTREWRFSRAPERADYASPAVARCCFKPGKLAPNACSVHGETRFLKRTIASDATRGAAGNASGGVGSAWRLRRNGLLDRRRHLAGRCVSRVVELVRGRKRVSPVERVLRTPYVRSGALRGNRAAAQARVRDSQRRPGGDKAQQNRARIQRFLARLAGDGWGAG